MQHGGQQKQLEAWYCENEKKTRTFLRSKNAELCSKSFFWGTWSEEVLTLDVLKASISLVFTQKVLAKSTKMSKMKAFFFLFN